MTSCRRPDNSLRCIPPELEHHSGPPICQSPMVTDREDTEQSNTGNGVTDNCDPYLETSMRWMENLGSLSIADISHKPSDLAQLDLRFRRYLPEGVCFQPRQTRKSKNRVEI